MLKLYHNPHSRSAVVHTMLHEIGEPFEIVPVDLQKKEQKSPAFLALNPMGKIPVLSDDGVLVTEVPAILTYLADKYPKAGLAPAIDAPERGPYLRWMFFYGSCIEPAATANYLKFEVPPSTDVLIASGLGYLMGFKLIPERAEYTDYVARFEARPAPQTAKAADAARASAS